MADNYQSDMEGNRKVYVGNVDYQITPDRLQREMAIAGPILNCEIPYDKTGRPRGYAVVEFETATAARIAINTLGGLEINGRHITLREDRGKRNTPSGPATRTKPPILDSTSSPRHLPSLRPRRNYRNRRDYGDALKSHGRTNGGSSGSASSEMRRRVPRRRNGDTRNKSPKTAPGPSRVGGGAKVALKDSTSSSSSSRITDTSKNNESKKNKGRKRQLQRPRIRLDENLQDRLVYYGNLSWSANGANVSEFVGGLSCIIPTDHRGRSKGYALVEYPTDAEALDAVNKFSEVEFLGRRLIARLFVFKSATTSSSSGAISSATNKGSAASDSAADAAC